MQQVQSIINSSAFTLMSAIKEIFFFNFILTSKLLGIAPQYILLQALSQIPCAPAHHTTLSRTKYPCIYTE